MSSKIKAVSSESDQVGCAVNEVRVSRRSILRGTVIAMPAILTLQSGAALARSSNLISASTTAYTDAAGRTLCLDVNSVYPADGSGQVYDVGDPPFAKVNAITDREHFTSPNSAVSEATMCRDGGTYLYKDSGWKEVTVPKGILVSATALASFAGGIAITDI